ncbi:unnamed protein product [Lactuca saligna]|uniref:Disease resistance protein Roq1-like winged-helix domain-containing protein n=1 Tax=Lactuca saligna TaxID=75948 RepID=A0AA35VJS3_LACSI|nr:unnamed protein product [Lactuca saligna]
MAMLDACGFHPVIGIKVLVQKALITITEYGKFDMHDLVQEMAHYIVRGEHPNNPEKHSRIWKKEDVLKICAMDAMTEGGTTTCSPESFPPRELCCLTLEDINAKQLWEGYKDDQTRWIEKPDQDT